MGPCMSQAGANRRNPKNSSNGDPGQAEGVYLPAWQPLVRTQILRCNLNLAIDTLSQVGRVIEWVSKNHALSEAGERAVRRLVRASLWGCSSKMQGTH